MAFLRDPVRNRRTWGRVVFQDVAIEEYGNKFALGFEVAVVSRFRKFVLCI